MFIPICYVRTDKSEVICNMILEKENTINHAYQQNIIDYLTILSTNRYDW